MSNAERDQSDIIFTQLASVEMLALSARQFF
jgi:hypothetical protein